MKLLENRLYHYYNQGNNRDKKVGGLMMPALNNGFRLLLSSYAQAINKQECRSGSLFRQRTKAKLLDDKDEYYPFIYFTYIHQNPMKAGLVDKMEDWELARLGIMQD